MQENSGPENFQANKSGLKEVINKTRTDASERSKWSSDSNVWADLLTRLRHSMDNNETDRILLLQLANNISATIVAGKTALSSGFYDEFIELTFPNGVETRLQWQILANLSVGFDHSIANNVTTGFSKQVANESKVLMIVCDQTLAIPYLMFIKNICSIASKEQLQKLIFNSGLFALLMRQVPEWSDDNAGNSSLITSTAMIMSFCIQKGLIPTIITQYRNIVTILMTMLDLLAQLFSSKRHEMSYLQTVSFWNNEAGSDLSDIIKAEIIERIPELIDCIINRRREEESSLILWDMVRTLLDLEAQVLSFAAPQTSTDDDQQNEKLLHELIALLKATKYLPAKTKLSDTAKSESLDPRDFPYLKSSLIPVIAALVKSNKSFQDEIRVSGALNTILECCVIDANNPFMKERAIVCIRYLLENNQDNQDFVASMEARKVINGKELADAGYETEIVGGNIQIKGRKS